VTALLLSLLLSGGVTIPPGVNVVDETTPQGRVQTLTFTGAGVTCAGGSGAATCSIPGGGSGSANVVAVTVAFGTGQTTASTVVTGQAWVTSSSVIVCTPTLLAASGRAEGAEDAIIEGISGAVHTRSAGVGFTLTVGKPGPGMLYGSFIFHCTGS